MIFFLNCEKSCLNSPQNSNKTSTLFVKNSWPAFFIALNTILYFEFLKISLFDLWASNLSYQVLQCLFQPFPYLLKSFLNGSHFYRKLLYRYPFETTRKLASHISLQCSLNISSFPLFFINLQISLSKMKENIKIVIG